ncbi:MAG TPA: SDR family NAD(P)-dependent oxidoreductase [Bryobacteraceae bacterium]|nr:SDR family NAD(P)-dependent oxidoreductase [Bryobacteraceae bacterium]
MKVDLQGKVALVTGARMGIGKAIALALAANGAAVAVNDVHPDGEQTVGEIREGGVRSVFLQADVSRSEEVRQMIAVAEREFGGIDILVNNAGVNTAGPDRRTIEQFSEAEWRRVLSVDLDGVFHCCRAAAPGMVARRGGTIINISSVMGMVPARMQLAYTSAKAGVINFTRSIALELAPHGIRANVIAPGSTLTAGTRALFYNPEQQSLAESLLSFIPLGRPATPEDIAHAALFLAASESSYITGAVLPVDGGWTAGFTRNW